MCLKNIFILEKNRGCNPSKQKFCTRDCLFIKNILALVLLKKYNYFSRYWKKKRFLSANFGGSFHPLKPFFGR